MEIEASTSCIASKLLNRHGGLIDHLRLESLLGLTLHLLSSFLQSNPNRTPLTQQTVWLAVLWDLEPLFLVTFSGILLRVEWVNLTVGTDLIGQRVLHTVYCSWTRLRPWPAMEVLDLTQTQASIFLPFIASSRETLRRLS